MTSATVAQDIGNVLLIISMALAVACVVAYHIKTRGAWNASEVGRHLMVFMFSMAAVLIVSVIRVIIVSGFDSDEPSWFFDVRILIFASIPAVLAWRLYIILTADRDKEYGHDR